MSRTSPNFRVALLILGLIAASVLMSSCDPAKAQVTNDNLTWTAPTQRVDGSALAPNEILQYQVLTAKVCTGTFTLLQTVGPSPLSFTRSNRPDGRQCYKLRTVDTTGLISPDSATVFTEKCPLAQRVNAAGDCVPLSPPREPGNVQAS